MKMKCTLHAKPSLYDEGGFEFNVFSHEDMSSCGYTACDTVEVEFNEPPRDVMVNGAIAAFREEQKRIRAEAQSRIDALDDVIQRMLSIEHKPDPQA